MPDICYSLTERYIMDPVLSMRAPLRYHPDAPPAIRQKIWHVVEAEVLARVAALFTSIFAAADAFIHLTNGTYKGSYLLLKKFSTLKPAAWDKREVIDHFRAATFFAGITLVGSIAGFIWPDIFKYFRGSPTNPGNNRFNSDENDEIPAEIEALSQAVRTGKEITHLHTCAPSGISAAWLTKNGL